MSQRLTNSQRVVAKVFREKLHDSLVPEQDLAGCIERLIVDFDTMPNKLSSANVKDFIKKHMKGTNSDESVVIRNTLCALCIFMMLDDLTSFWDMQSMKEEFRGVEEFQNVEETEWVRLLKYQAIVKTAHDLFGGVGQKGRVLFIANHLTGVEVVDDSLHGQKMSTGSGASKATKRRCMIYHRISDVPVEKRDTNKGKKRPLEEADDELPPTATEEELREYQEAVVMLNEVKRRASQREQHSAPVPVVVSPPLIPTSSSSSAILDGPAPATLSLFSEEDFNPSAFLADLCAQNHDSSVVLFAEIGTAQPSAFTCFVQSGAFDACM